MGLITKAIEKVETQDTPPIQIQEPPEPKPKSKKRTVILLAALLFVMISVGLGYIFLIKPATETPPKVTPRSMSARKKPVRPTTTDSPAVTDTTATRADEKEEIAPEKTPTQTGTQPSLAKEPMANAKQKQKMTGSKEESSTNTIPSRSTDKKAEPLTSETQKQTASELTFSLSPETEQEITEEIIPQEDKQKTPTEGVLPQVVSPESKRLFSKEISPPPPKESKKETPPVNIFDKTQALGLEKSSSRDVALSPQVETKNKAVPKPLGIVDKSASRAEKYYRRGFSYHQEGDMTRAIDSYKRALAYDTNHQLTHMNLATAYMQTGKYKEAERELTYLYATKPKDPKILYNFGLLLYQTGELTSAETKLNKLLEYDPYNLEANLLLSSIYEEKGELNKAVDYCMKAYRVNSTDPRILYKSGRTFDMNGDKENAIKYYRLFLQSSSVIDEKSQSEVRERLNFLLIPKEGK